MAALVGLSAGAADFQRSTILAPKQLHRSMAADVNGDGLADLLFLANHTVHIFLQRREGFQPAADHTVRLPDDTGAVDLGLAQCTVQPRPGLRRPMLVLLLPDGVYAIAQHDGRFADPPRRLAKCHTLFSRPCHAPDFADFVVDLNRDRVEEVLVPGEDHLHLFAANGPFALKRVQSLPLKWDRAWSARQTWCPIPKEGSPGRHAVSVRYKAGVLMALDDWNGDGLLDLRTARTHWDTGAAVHHIYYQLARGGFTPEPAATYHWPLHRDTRDRLIDLDRDGRPELVSTAVLPHRWLPWMLLLPEPQSTFVYRLNDRGAFEPQPCQRFTSSLVSHPTLFMDFNRDGWCDAVTFRCDIRAGAKEQVLRALVDRAFTYTVGVHLSKRGVLPAQPTAHKTVDYRLERLAMPFIVPLVETHADVDGDGRPDLVVETRTDRVVVYGQTDSGFTPKPILRLKAPAGSCLSFIEDLNGDGAADATFVSPAAGHARLTILLSRR